MKKNVIRHSGAGRNLLPLALLRKIPAFAGMTLCVFLAACIDVENFGDEWAKAKSDACIDAIAQEFFEDEPKPGSMNDVVRVMSLDTHRFMMLKEKAGDKGGSIQRFEVKDGDYVPLSLKKEKREDFLKAYPSTTIIVHEETVTIPVLDAANVRILTEIAGQPDYWQAGESKKYNPKGDKNCKF